MLVRGDASKLVNVQTDRLQMLRRSTRVEVSEVDPRPASLLNTMLDW